MFPYQGGYQQASVPPNPAMQAQYTGPPPAKKVKGNPVITKYPPPPGYQGGARPPGPYHTPSWPQPSQAYPYPQPGYPAYPAAPYQPAPAFQTPQWAGYQQQSYPHAATSPPFGHLAGVPTPGPAWGPPPNATPHGAVPSAFPAAPTHSQKARRHNSAPFPASSANGGYMDGNGDPFPTQQASSFADDNATESAYDDECYYARHPDEIVPELSLGLIEWQSAVPTKHALPSTFQEAELDVLAPRKSDANTDFSVSRYFTAANHEEALLSVRQTELWGEIKDDVIFRELGPLAKDYLSMSELFERYRDRQSPQRPVNGGIASPGSAVPFTLGPTLGKNQQRDSMMESDHDSVSAGGDVLHSLEQALFADTTRKGPGGRAAGTSRPGPHSRTTSVSSQLGERPTPINPIRDPAQEDILAALGVTGSPKAVYQTPGPAFGPPPSREGSVSSTSRVPMSGSHPTAKQQDWQNHMTDDAWSERRNHQSQAHYLDRPSSRASQQTAPGSDFHDEDDNTATPRPAQKTADNRKRGFDDTDDAANGVAAHWQDDEDTPRQRRKQQRL